MAVLNQILFLFGGYAFKYGALKVNSKQFLSIYFSSRFFTCIMFMTRVFCGRNNNDNRCRVQLH